LQFTSCTKLNCPIPDSQNLSPLVNPARTPVVSNGIVTTVAGSGVVGYVDAPDTTASFSYPSGVAIDSAGNVYVADWDNNAIRKISPAGVVSTFDGLYTLFNSPHGVAIDNVGTVYVADYGDNVIRKITAAGAASILAGNGNAAAVNGAGAAASFNSPTGIAVDKFGTVYVADYGNHLIRKITPAGVVSTLAGSGSPALVNDTGTAASFNNPYGLTADTAGNVYVADRGNNAIRKITADGVVTTLAGTGKAGAANGLAAAATFNNPSGIVKDSYGNFYVADTFNNIIRAISASGVVSTYAGLGRAAFNNGPVATASFFSPTALTIDASGNLYVSDYDNHLVRKITK